MAACPREATHRLPSARAPVALALVALAVAGCEPQTDPRDATAIERALTPQTARTRQARALDGDTLEDPELGRIRLIGIDAPEMSEPGGGAAAEFLDAFVRGSTIGIAFSALWPLDAYGRRLAVVYALGPEGWVCVNAELLRHGLATSSHRGPCEVDVRAMVRSDAPSLPASARAAAPGAHPAQVTVYATAKGSRYHRRGCSSARNASPLSLRAAIERGLEPCRRCRPPIPVR